MRFVTVMATILETIVEYTGRVTAWATFALAVTMATNVLLRYGFSTGAVWAQELEWHWMVVITMLGVAYALQHDGHVRVDVLYSRFPPALRQRVDLLTEILLLAVCIAAISLSMGYVLASWRLGETSTNPGGVPARYLLKTLIPVGFGLIAMAALARVLRIAMAMGQARRQARETRALHAAE